MNLVLEKCGSRESFEAPKFNTWRQEYSYLLDTISEVVLVKIKEKNDLKSKVIIGYYREKLEDLFNVFNKNLQESLKDAETKLKATFADRDKSRLVINDVIIDWVAALEAYEIYIQDLGKDYDQELKDLKKILLND